MLNFVFVLLVFKRDKRGVAIFVLLELEGQERHCDIMRCLPLSNGTGDIIVLPFCLISI